MKNITFKDVYKYTGKLSVLYVEDDAEIRQSTALLLTDYFSTVDVVADGHQGLAKYHEELTTKPYDIVITNINLPGLSGLEMLKAIRFRNEEQQFVLMTSRDKCEAFLDAIRTGFNYYLLKPLSVDELSNVLYHVAKNIRKQNQALERLVTEKQRIEQNERYQKALLRWSNVDFENTGESIKELTKLASHTLNVSRVSFWLFNAECTAMVCEDLYIRETDTHSHGMILEKHHFPRYFKALNEQSMLVIKDARKDVRTSELKDNYLEPLGIFSMLKIPILQNKEFLGIICHEAIGAKRDWSIEEQEFAMTLSNNIALSIEIKKRYEVQAQLENQKNKLDYEVHHDQLTDLPNRALFIDRLEQSIIKNHRQNTKVALFFIDLDRFKEINDSMGHDAGDLVLKELAKRLAAQIRKSDTLARLGGDEFTIILDDIQDPDVVTNIIQKLLACTQEAFIINGKTLFVTLSIGISLFPDDGIDVDSLLRNADAAMYKAKDNGRNTYEFYTLEMTINAVERVMMEANLRQAIDKQEMYLNYQPQYDATCNKLIGMEALIRWKNRDYGIIAPDKFIPFAEEVGLIIGIDRWVMETSMQQFSQWYKDDLNPGVLSLNLAMQQLQDKTFIPFLSSLLEKYNFSSDWLELEITEGRIMKDPEVAIKTLSRVKALGISLAIDDFGTGYSSLSYLKRLPIDTLKIDRAFIMELPDNEEDEAISKAIIALAKSLNLNLIAEGVETIEQKNFLVEHGCDLIQGYYYSKPLSDIDMQAHLKTPFIEGQLID
ncbi:EAL domain-containing protein [sulfur-oxidizing endosymbiont of Gigantopelta aegis]|uniref:EAL domain-containing protein n=1 Tax=sulfur-oxidizing endosymbiont of Gigantopelta aegis TaxID=2794934 RepID=UPI0018DD7DD9|nr:EAL domain-containing protein [sulfur-oxidizing endosymbiont of Gigantopelta aegis]